ncbi:hypothetical protein SEA_MALISHA_78 [Gordonia phage Malisha]|nr:hypothetical protein SEA_MALISHA_78 [Gordonia phage Malisha]
MTRLYVWWFDDVWRHTVCHNPTTAHLLAPHVANSGLHHPNLRRNTMSERNAYNAVRRLVAERDQLRQDLAAHADPYSERNQAASAWMAISKHPLIGDISTLPERGTYAESVRARLNEIAANTSLPEPDATNPDHWRFAARLADYMAKNDSGLADEQAVVRYMLHEADRLDAARSAEREREQRIEAVAKVLADFTFTSERDRAARALEDAGLLRDGVR